MSLWAHKHVVCFSCLVFTSTNCVLPCFAGTGGAREGYRHDGEEREVHHLHLTFTLRCYSKVSQSESSLSCGGVGVWCWIGPAYPGQLRKCSTFCCYHSVEIGWWCFAYWYHSFWEPMIVHGSYNVNSTLHFVPIPSPSLTLQLCLPTIKCVEPWESLGLWRVAM